MMTEAEIHDALKSHELEVTFEYDYTPSIRPDKALEEEIEFEERAWRVLLLAATNRRKSSRQLNDRQNEIRRRSRLDERGFRVRVLTVRAALHLQRAGYRLECTAKRFDLPAGDRQTADCRRGL